MTEEWLRVDDLMDHVDLLMKAFDSMADGHLLLSGNMLPARLEGVRHLFHPQCQSMFCFSMSVVVPMFAVSQDEGAFLTPSSNVNTAHPGMPSGNSFRARGKHLLDDSAMDAVAEDGIDGDTTHRSSQASAKFSRESSIASAASAGEILANSPMRALRSLGVEGSPNTPPISAPALNRQSTSNSLRSGQPSSKSSGHQSANHRHARHTQPHVQVNMERQKALAVQEFLDSTGLNVAKAYDAAVVDRMFMGYVESDLKASTSWNGGQNIERAEVTEDEEADEVKKVSWLTSIAWLHTAF